MARPLVGSTASARSTMSLSLLSITTGADQLPPTGRRLAHTLRRDKPVSIWSQIAVALPASSIVTRAWPVPSADTTKLGPQPVAGSAANVADTDLAESIGTTQPVALPLHEPPHTVKT